MIAVASGHITIEQPREAGADHALASLEEGMPLRAVGGCVMSLGYQKQLLTLAFGRPGSLPKNLLGIEREPGRSGPRARRRSPA